MTDNSEYTPTTADVRIDFARPFGDLGIDRGARGEAFDRWLAAHDREVAERAWDEGFDAGEKDAWDVDVTNEKHVCTPNPYRSASEGDNQ